MFGLDVRGSFAAPGLSGLGVEAAAVRVDAEIVGDPDLAEGWPAQGSTRLVDWRYDDGEPATTIDWHDGHGYRIFAAGYGRFRIAAGGLRVECAPAAVDAWQWQRYLLGQVLPITAVLHGREVLHASAVALEGRAVGFVAGRGVGKTSLALNLVLRGHRFMTDDVLALTLRDGRPIAHPGPAVTNLRAAEHERLGAAADRLGAVVGRDGDGLRIALEREERALPLGALYLLERGGEGTEAEFERIDPGFRLLFANGFDFLVSGPDRLSNQLCVFAALESEVPVFRVSIPQAVDASALAAHIEAHASALGG